MDSLMTLIRYLVEQVFLNTFIENLLSQVFCKPKSLMFKYKNVDLNVYLPVSCRCSLSLY